MSVTINWKKRLSDSSLHVYVHIGKSPTPTHEIIYGVTVTGDNTRCALSGPRRSTKPVWYVYHLYTGCSPANKSSSERVRFDVGITHLVLRPYFHPVSTC